MSIWSKGVDRSLSDKNRKENDLTNPINEFFNNQNYEISYEIVDDKNWVVNVDGNLHLNQSDLDEGKLFFKIGKLAGNLYFYGKHMSPSVIPDKMSGEIIFVPDEKELAKTRGQKGNNQDDELDMGLLRAKPTKAQLYKKLEEIMSEAVYNNYDFDIDKLVSELKSKAIKEAGYNLKIEFGKKTQNSQLYTCKIYVDDSGEPLNLSAIETAVYLTFMLFEDGIKPDYLTPKFYERIRGIYQKLSDTVQDWSETSGGVLVKEFDVATLNGHRSMIRSALKQHISNKNVVDKFAIEGEKNKPFKVGKATDDIRNQIKSTFGVQ